jgi:hypothetical protein
MLRGTGETGLRVAGETPVVMSSRVAKQSAGRALMSFSLWLTFRVRTDLFRLLYAEPRLEGRFFIATQSEVLKILLSNPPIHAQSHQSLRASSQPKLWTRELLEFPYVIERPTKADNAHPRTASLPPNKENSSSASRSARSRSS